MLKRYFLLVVVALFSWSVQAEAIDMSNPYTMMKQVANHTFARLKQEQPKIRQNPNYLKTVVNEELMPYVNSQYAALKLLGPNLKGAKRSDVATFIDAFGHYLVTNYAQVLTQYNHQTIEFGPAPKIDAHSRITSVIVNIVDSPNPNIRLEFKLRRARSGDWQAFDMIAEGVSLLSSKRSEWSDKIHKEGIAPVAQELEKLANEPVHFESKK